jgi:hypothetical protein
MTGNAKVKPRTPKKPRALARFVAAVAAVVAGLVLAGTAVAAIPSPTTPYPTVALNPKVCQAEAIKVQQALVKYNAAVATYQRILKLAGRGAASAESLRNAQAAVDNAGIALNDANYAQATCQNNQAAPANKDCINLALELNRLIDDLAYTKDLEAIAAANYKMALQLKAKGAISDEDFQAYDTNYQLAQLQTKLVTQQIADQRAKTTAAKCKDVDRPTPTATPTGTPTGSCDASDTPTTTDSAAPTDSSTPSPVPTSADSCLPPWTDPCAFDTTLPDTSTPSPLPTPTDILTYINGCISTVWDSPSPTDSPVPTDSSTPTPAPTVSAPPTMSVPPTVTPTPTSVIPSP